MSAPVLTAVAWPYANGPRHIGHVSGFGVPSDIFARYQRMAGNRVLMISGTDEHGTPIQVQADREGVTPRELVDKYNRVIVGDLQGLGLTYDLFTRTSTANHHRVVQDVFSALHRNGYITARTAMGAVSPSTGRTLPDRYIEGTCPICGYDGARGDQCDNCGNQLDPADLLNPRSRINGEVPQFVETEHLFLDLPAFTKALGSWLAARTEWRPNVLKFSLNQLDDLRPRPITRDLDWGVRVPLDGWRDAAMKRFYVWFDACMGYLSASVEWAARSGDPDAWQQWWRGTVIYVGDFLREFGPDALRYFISVAGPENQDTDFTWDEFVRRINFELANEWGNLVNRAISMAHRNVGAVPRPATRQAVDEELLATSRAAFGTVGDLLERNRVKSAIGEAMRVVGAANKYLSEQEPWKRKDDPQRRDTILHTALQVVSDANTLLTPFLPHAAQQVHELLGGTGVWSAQPQISEVSELVAGSGPDYPVLTGDYTAEQAQCAA